MALSERQEIARKGKMTGSRIGTLVSGSSEDLYNLWLELTGDPSFKPPDYSNNFAVQLGNATEKFHLDWIERALGTIDCLGDSLQHPKVEWAAVTLDGWAKRDGVPVEAKHTGGFESMDTIIDRYMPQMQWTMFCAGVKEVAFSVIQGAKEPKPLFIGYDSEYVDDLVDEAEAFMKCVRELREPIPNPFIKPPKPVFTRIVDMTGNNEWGFHASAWLSNRVAFQKYNESAKAIKNLMPSDAKEGWGHGIIVKRSKAGALTIKLENDDDEAKAED
jgi:hypothetical protein